MKIERLPKEYDQKDAVAVPRNIATNIRKARMKVGLSQSELARMIGLETATAISLMESEDRKVSCTQLWKIAAITGEDIRSFFFNGLI